MGISLAWVAVKGLELDTVLSRLELEAIDRTVDWLESDIAAHSLPGDALLVMALGCDHRIVEADSMIRLSVGCEAMACAVEEHVNFSSCALWRDGRQIWQAEYVGCEVPEEFTHEGELPARFHELLAHVEPEDSDNLDGVFLMDIPLILAKDFSGFHYAETDAAFDAVPSHELKDVRARARASGGWWKRLWG